MEKSKWAILALVSLLGSCQTWHSSEHAAVPVTEKKGVKDCVTKSTTRYYEKGRVTETMVDVLDDHNEYSKKTRDLGGGLSQVENRGVLRSEFYILSDGKKQKPTVSDYTYETTGTESFTKRPDGNMLMDRRLVKIMNGRDGYKFPSQEGKEKTAGKVVGIWEQVVYEDNEKGKIISYTNNGHTDNSVSTTDEKRWTEGDLQKSETTTSSVEKDAGGQVSFEMTNVESCSEREIK